MRGLTRALVGRADVVWFGDDSLAPDGIVETIRVPGPYPALDTRIGQRIAQRSGVDVFHFMGNTGWLRRGSVPMVLTIQDLIYFDRTRKGRTPRQRVGHIYLRFNTRRAAVAAHCLAVPSEATAREVVDRFQPSGQPQVIPWGVDRPQGTPNRTADQPYVVAFCARDPRKGVAGLLDAWRDMPPDGPELRLLAGGGLLPDLERRVRAEFPGRGVQVLGYLPREELWDVIRGSVALVHPATADGFAFPVLEAMAAGVPVIGGLSQAALELGGEALLRIDPRDVRGSIRRLASDLAADPALRAEAAARATARADAFSWDATADRYLELYEQAVGVGRAERC